MNQCSSDGWVVDDRAMPIDAVDHDFARVPILGCTNLRCSLCGATVRSIARYNFAVPNPHADVLRALLDAEDPTASPHLTTAPFRLYICRCQYHTEVTQHPLDDLDGGVRVAGTWKCAGHPIVELPHTFDGVLVAPDTIAALVDQALAGAIPPGAHAMDQTQASWVARLCVRLEGTTHARSVAAAVAAHLTDPDVMVRTRAVRFFTTLGGRYIEVARPDELLRTHAALFEGVPNAFKDISREPSLAEALWRLLGNEVARTPALRDLAREIAMDPARATYPVFYALVEGDVDWFDANAEALVRANPTRVKDLLSAARDHVAIAKRINAAAKA